MTIVRPKFIQSGTSTLAVGITSAETGQIVLTKLLDIYGNQITMADFGPLGYCTFEPGSDNEEIISFADFTVNADGSVSIDTTITRAVAATYPYSNSGTARSHAAGSIVVFSNNPSLYESILAYVEDVAISGAPNASLIAKGILQLGSTTDVNAGTATGSTGAALAVTPDVLIASIYGLQLPTSGQKAALAGTSGTPGSGNKYITENDVSAAGGSDKVVRATGGALPALSGTNLTGIAVRNCGDGSDGDVTIAAGTTTLTRHMYYNNLTITGTLVTAGFIVYVKGTLSGAGTIKFAATPNNGTAGASGATHTGGTGGATQGSFFASKAGGGGGAGTAPGGSGTGGTNGGNAVSALGVAGVAGGAGGAGSFSSAGGAGTGGTVTVPNFRRGIISSLTLAGLDIVSAAIALYTASGGAGGGGGGGSSNGGTGNGGGGGGAGEAGGLIMLVVNNWAGTFTISSVGANGGAGGDSTGSGGGGGGGGSGGAGGAALIFYIAKTWTGSYALTGGTAGAAGATVGGGSGGSAGTAGTTGTSTEIAMSTLTL